MAFSRRTFVSTIAAWPCFACLPQQVFATAEVGTGILTTVSDGHLVLPGSFLFDPMPNDELVPLLAEYGLSKEQLDPPCNLALYRDDEKTVLFDAGSGPDFMPTAGKLVDSLDAVGLAPDDVTHVVFTHAHPDHIWGLLDEFDDPLFTGATYMMGRAEWDYWWNPETVNTIGHARAAFAVGAKRRMEAIEDQVEFFDDGQEILPGISAVASYGHTPGHMSFELRNGAEAALLVGDAIGNHHVAFARPDWHSGSDQDMEQAARTRMRLLDRLAQEKMLMVGFHLPDGGMGRVERADEGFRFVGGNQ
ncbi:MBL fold metallo-hydrolase [Roseovarius sp. CAU 1744]|uniref:MBL fold metallo-hydrolase n=1 Tax=Roseovarius sp. CAU 1744 TaxID=3140368 RepID=UPI00325A8857